MKCESKKSSRAPSEADVEAAEEVERDTFFHNNQPYVSQVTADHGFEYQRELLLYFCLQFMKMDNCTWTSGIEVVDSERFDDIVVEFTLNGRHYAFLMQAKHVLSDSKVITLEHLLETDKVQMKSNTIKKNFALLSYAEAVKSVTWSRNRTRKFFLLTNYQLNLDLCEFEYKVKKDATPKKRTVKVPETRSEPDEMVAKMFKDIKDVTESTKFTQFTREIELIDKNTINYEYFLDNFTLISDLPNLTNLVTINNHALKKEFRSEHFITMRAAVYKSLETRKVHLPAQDSEAEGRDQLSREKFIRVIQNSVLEEDLPLYTSEFLSKFPKWLDFSKESLRKITSQKVRQYYCRGNAKLMAFMLHKGLSEESKKDGSQMPFCIPYTKLTKLKDIYKKSLKTFEREVVVYVESKNANEDFTDYGHAVFVIQSNKEPNQNCTFADLTTSAREEFKKTIAKFQGFNVKVSDLTTNGAFLTEILQEVCISKKPLTIGMKLPIDKLPKYYISREFSNNGVKLTEDDIFERGKNTIIQGLGGTGKSTAMIKLAESVKQKHQDYFVHYVDLKAHSRILHEMKLKQEHAKYLNYFIGFIEKEKEDKRFERMLIDAYLSEQVPKIVIFLDGFDEIAPLYTDQVIEIINSLKQKKVQMFVSSQSHLKEKMELLEFDKNYTLEPYSKPMQGDFLRLYWTNCLEEKIAKSEIASDAIEMQNINVYTKKFFQMCYKSMLTDITPSIPLTLNILADIYCAECTEFCMKSNDKKSYRFLEVDVLTVYERIFRENCKKFDNKRQIDRYSVYFAQTEEECTEEWRQRYMSIAIEGLQGDIWKQENCNGTKKYWAEVYGRGFITGNTTDDYTFIYDTFKEYFAADWLTRQIFPANGALKLDLLKLLLRNDKNPKKASDGDGFTKGIRRFVYRFVLKKLKELQKNNSLVMSETEKKQVAEFILEFLPHAWFNTETTQLETTYHIAVMFCDPEAVKKVCESKQLLEKVPLTAPEQLQLSVDIYDHFFGVDKTKDKTKGKTNAILTRRIVESAKDREKILNLILKTTNFPLFEKLFEIMTNRGIYPEKNFIAETYKIFQTYLKKQKIKDWMFVRDLFLWYFPRIKSSTQEDILEEVKMLLEGEKFQGRHYLGHILASFWEWKNYDGSFIETLLNVADECKSSQKYYKLLYALNSITREDIFIKTIEVMRQNGCRFINYGTQSVMFDAMVNNNSYLLEKLLKLLTKEEIEEQIGAQVCRGKHLINYCTAQNHICEIFIQFMVNKYGDRVTELCFTPIAADATATEENVKIFATFFRKDMKVDESILQGLVRRLCDECSAENFMEFVVTERGTEPVTEYILKYLLKTKVDHKKEEGDGV